MREQGTGYRITDLEPSERPRERLAAIGAENLNKAELLAILLRTGVPGENAVELAQRLINEFNGLSGLQKASFEEVCAQHGIGTAKAAQLKAAIELGNRLRLENPDEKPAIHSPQDAAELVMYRMQILEQEELWVILLDTRNQVLKTEKVYKGSVNQSQVRVAELFKAAIRNNAPQLIVVHNHPSGDPTPSPDDIAITRQICQAGKLLDIEILDHLVIGNRQWVSLKQRGLGFNV
jgi:DNA repair protein RadC